MVTKDGLVKVLDFGLAKLTSTMSGSGEGSHLPTMTATIPGTVVGTVGYMSPEQASGESLDFRSDQFSLGSILYEMVTGKRAFQKKTPIDTLAAVLNEEPEPIASLNPNAPLPLRWIAERCLAKEPRQRYASTDDLARDLATVRDRLSEAVTSGGSPTVARRRRSPRALLLGALAVSLAVGALAARWLWLSKGASVPRFQQVTFQKENIYNARFGPDGQTIVYTVRRGGRKLELLQTRAGSHGSRSLGIRDAIIKSVSASGEMALWQESGDVGVLAIASLGGGEPRVRERDVDEADWAPDGKTLAILRATDKGTRVEFPSGNVLCEGCGGRIRVSPRGDRVAVLDGPHQLAVVDRNKKKTRLAGSAQEFGWSPGGDEVWFTRIVDGSTHLFAVSLGGRERMLASLPGDFTLYDISREGRALFERGTEQWEVLGRFPGDEHEHGYKWLDQTVPQDLSADGKLLLFAEKEPGWNDATSYLRRTDGSPAVPLGEGFCRAISPDGKWAVCRSELMAPSLRLQSTSGETRDLPNGGLEYPMALGVDWLPDGEGIVFNAKQPGHPERLFVQSVKGSPPEPITPEGVGMVGLSQAVSPDGKFVVGIREGVAALYPVKGGDVLPIPGLLPGDLPTQWSNDGKALYLQRDDSPGKVWLLDRPTGQRRLFRELRPPDTGSRPGIGDMWGHVLLSRDGQSYVHMYSGWLADLFVLDGLK